MAGKANFASSSRARTMNSCLVKFEDGYTMVTSRNALRLADSNLFDTYQINGLPPTAGR
jgi:hypothetical protein